MRSDIRIAAVVCRCPVGQVERNLNRTGYWAEQARRKGADLVCFPELNLTGYSNKEEVANNAISATGPEMEPLIQMAEKLKIVLLAGFTEKDKSEKIYASHAVITPKGEIGIYRKIHLAPPEMDRYTPGDSLPVFSWSGIRFGIQLCYDAHFPELSTRMAEVGADLIVIPHASPMGRAIDKHRSWMRHLPARAYDNSLFVIACNQSGNNGNGLDFPGNSMILSPSGEIIAAQRSGNSGILMADLKREQIDHVRNHRMRYFFPNRRPGLYRRKPIVNTLDGH
jgi:N-carbamoylputrescine amidase